MKIKLFYIESDGDSFDAVMQAFQHFMAAPKAMDVQKDIDVQIIPTAPRPKGTRETPIVQVEATTAPRPKDTRPGARETPIAQGEETAGDATPAIDWPASLRDVAERLDTGRTSWRKVDRATRQALAVQMIRTLISQNYCTMPEFNRRRPAWMPKALSLAASFNLKWSELVDLTLPSKAPPPANIYGSNGSAGHVQQAPAPRSEDTRSPLGANGHSEKGGYL